jgi:hypothetical protein
MTIVAFRIDTSASPVILVSWDTMPDIAQATQFFDDMTKLHDEAHARGVKLVVVMDIAYTATPGADVRSALAAGAKRLAGHPAVLFQCAALRSAAQRGVVTVVTWFVPSLSSRFRTVKDVREGWQVATEVLARNGIVVPAEPAWLTARATG